MERHTRSFLQLIKPGITISNSMTAGAGFILASSQVGFDPLRFVATVLGIALVIASACVANNMIDRNIDARMKRTKGREIAAGKISLPVAAGYSAGLAIAGFGLLYVLTNWYAVLFGVLAFVWYVVIYGWAKRATSLSTIIGAVCGALPPMAGYVAATGVIDATAWWLFALMMVWQLPHFYAIAMFRAEDYRLANIPVWSVKYGLDSTKRQIYFWIIAFFALAPILSVTSATGWVYFVAMLAVGSYWIWQAGRNFDIEDDVKWARRQFGISLLVLLTMSLAWAIGGYLP